MLFCSKELHCLIDIIGQIENKELNADIEAVIANHPEAKHICNSFNIPFEYISEKNKSKKQYEDEMFKRLEDYSYECIGLAKYMQILSASFKKVDVPIINIHHSFLPAFVGANPYRQAYNKGVKLIGATAHYVTETLDDGPIITQEVTPVTHSYSINDLKKEATVLKKVFSDALNKHINNKIAINNKRTIIFH